MTKEQAKILLPVIQAWVEGKTIQFKSGDNSWQDFPSHGDPNFQLYAPEWRVKPEPREFWIMFSKFKDPAVYQHEPFQAPGDAQIVHVREVLEEPEPSKPSPDSDLKCPKCGGPVQFLLHSQTFGGDVFGCVPCARNYSREGLNPKPQEGT